MQSTNSNLSSTGSTRDHRKAQRANGGTEILGLTVATVSLIGSIPPRVVQSFISGRACLFKAELKPHERFTHGCQTALTVAQIIIIIVLYYENKDTCEKSTSALCKTLNIADLIYAGILLLNWGHAEINKDQNEITQHTTLQTQMSHHSRDRQDTPPGLVATEENHSDPSSENSQI